MLRQDSRDLVNVDVLEQVRISFVTLLFVALLCNVSGSRTKSRFYLEAQDHDCDSLPPQGCEKGRAGPASSVAHQTLRMSREEAKRCNHAALVGR